MYIIDFYDEMYLMLIGINENILAEHDINILNDIKFIKSPDNLICMKSYIWFWTKYLARFV